MRGVSPSWTVVGNPGSVTPESYVATPVADTLVLFERESGFDTYTAPAWQSKYAAGRFADLVVDVAASGQMQTSVSRRHQRRRLGLRHQRPRSHGRPVGHVPSYFNQLVTAVAAARRGRRTTPLVVTPGNPLPGTAGISISRSGRCRAARAPTPA